MLTFNETSTNEIPPSKKSLYLKSEVLVALIGTAFLTQHEDLNIPYVQDVVAMKFLCFM